MMHVDRVPLAEWPECNNFIMNGFSPSWGFPPIHVVKLFLFPPCYAPNGTRNFYMYLYLYQYPLASEIVAA